jgi:hypothetical protein
VDAVIVQPDGSCRAYFAKETYSASFSALGFFSDKRYSNYSEVVNP